MKDHGDALHDTAGVLYYGAGWPTNIGNAFIDLGSMELIRSAVPHAAIYFASEMPRWFFEYCGPEHRLLPGRSRAPKAGNAFDVAAYTHCDAVIVSGMAMCEEFIRINGPTLSALSSRGVPIIFAGTGAERYTDQERKACCDFYRDVNVSGFISRDDLSYTMFAGCFPRSERGIDCGFFVPEAYRPATLDVPPYIAATFDAMAEPPILRGAHGIIRAHHEPLLKIPKHCFTRKDTLISDLPHDYLTLYANSRETHSDRVHACVAALAYGRPARYYGDSPRGSLFDAAGVSGIREQPVPAGPGILGARKKQMIAALRGMIVPP